jgi:hypothetical protein
MTELQFTGILEAVTGGGARVAIDGDAREAFGEARAPVEGTVNGRPYRSRLAVYGGVTYLGLTKAFHANAGLEIGDELDVVLRRDDALREVHLPSELQRALDGAPAVRHRFDEMSFTHRREYARWVDDGKRQETRERRAAKAIEMLSEGVQAP